MENDYTTGRFKEGGVGIVQKVHDNGTYDVRMVVGGRKRKNVAQEYIIENGNRNGHQKNISDKGSDEDGDVEMQDVFLLRTSKARIILKPLFSWDSNKNALLPIE